MLLQLFQASLLLSEPFTGISDKRSEGFPVAPLKSPTSRAALGREGAFQVTECGGSEGIAVGTSNAFAWWQLAPERVE